MVLSGGTCRVPDVGDAVEAMNGPGGESGVRHQSYLTAPPSAAGASGACRGIQTRICAHRHTGFRIDGRQVGDNIRVCGRRRDIQLFA